MSNAEKYLEMHERGLSATEIARELGVTPQGVASWLRRHGKRPNGPGGRRKAKLYTPPPDVFPVPSQDRTAFDEALRFVEVWQRSESCAEVAEKLGGTVATVSRRATNFRKAGVPLKRFKAVTTIADTPGKREFIEAWESSTSGREAAEKLGMTLAQASCRAAYYRRAGVPLKRFRERLTRKEKESLAAAAERLLPGKSHDKNNPPQGEIA